VGVGIAAVLVITSRNRAPESGGRRSLAVNVALLASLSAILAVTLGPTDDPHDVRLVPLSDIGDAFTPSLDGSLLLEDVLNILLFVPLGAALGLRGVSLGKSVLTALALSSGVELAQAIIVTGRTTSVDDVLLNTLGVVVGHAVSALVVPILR
jgi:glycopeptide antibiotics resistance protein